MSVTDLIPVRMNEGTLEILDQTLLPLEEKFIKIESVEALYAAIKKLKVRGAPAIGVAAGYGVYIAAKDAVSRSARESSAGSASDSIFEIMAEIERDADYLISARPTAVNLKWAVDRVMAALRDAVSRNAVIRNTVIRDAVSRSEKATGDPIDADLPEIALAEAEAIRKEDFDACMGMAEYGLSLLKPGMGLLTHCNAGVLATAGYGTALAPIHLGQERGYDFKVFSDETRPLLQGARLTSWELAKNGVDVTLICDNMASIVMKSGKVDAVLVGCDRMAANGDGANKIGTSAVAILAKEYGIPFYMFVPTSTIDLETETGADIVIEERDPDEIAAMWYEERMAPEGVKTYNPAFDVTDAKYITAVVTEKGIVYPPFKDGLARIKNETEN